MYSFIVYRKHMDCSTEKVKNPEADFSSEGILTLIFPSNDRTYLLVKCTECQKVFIGMDGWIRHKKVRF